MNIKKGINRIALVLSIITFISVFVYFLHVNIIDEKVRIINPEWKEWSQDPEKYKKKQQEQYEKGLIKYNFSGLMPVKYLGYDVTSILKILFGAAIWSIISSLVVFFGIGGVTRLIIWIVKGFKEG